MRIFYKLIAGFILVILLTAAVSYIGMTATGNISHAYKNVVEETIPVIESLEKLRYLGINIHLYTHEFIFKIESKELLEGPEDIHGKLKETFEQYNNTIKKLDVLVEKYFPDEKERNDNLKRIGEKYIGLSNELIELKKSGASTENYIEIYQEFETVENEFLAAVDNATENENEEFQERTNYLESTIALSRNLVLIVSVLTFILAIVIGSAISMSISGPITILKDAADDIRRGKLDTAVDIRSNDETGVLGDAFNKMVSDLAHEIKEHKQTAADLREKNSFVKTVLESLPHPFYVIDTKDYTVTLANSAACVNGSAVGTACYALTHKADKPCWTKGHLCPLEEVKRTGKPAIAEHLHYGKDGNIRNMEVHCCPIFDDKGNVVQAIEYSLDITERKRAQEALAESEERYRTIIEHSKDVVWSLNKDGLFTFINKQAENVTGYRISDFIGKSFLPLLNRDDIPRMMEIFQKTLSGKMSQYELTIKRRDGSDLTLFVNSTAYYSKGEITGTLSFARDITHSKLAEVALRESEERFRSVAQAANDAIIFSDSYGKIIFWNNAAQKFFGYDSSEVMGKPITILMPETYREDHINVLERMRTTGESHIIGKTVEFPALRKNGIEFPVEITLSTWKTGEKKFYSAILRDITERKRNEDMRRDNERLALANRTKSEFLAVMSHELRTPLNAIIGFSDLLKKKNAGELNEKQQRYADNVYSSGMHLLSLIDDILDITRVESGKMEIIIDKVCVHEIINESADLIKEKAAKQNIRIITQVSPDIEFIETDEKRFRQVLNNLIDNAVKFSKPEGGTVTITAAKETDRVKISVSDTGIGIKKEDIGRIFQSFEQLDAGITRKYCGTGLGLAVSKKLVELLGGRIKAESIYGEGSTFTFYLPETGGGMI